MNRRDFMKAGAAAGIAGAAAMGGYVAHAAERTEPYRVGLIGTGWYGKSDLMRLIQVAPVEVVSLCDVDKNLLNGAAEMVSQRQKSKKKPRLYGDYREMLKEKDLDLCIVVTPDHWHALNMIAAVEAGAHVYCQKPISRDVLEGEAMVAAARKHKRVVQVGTQRKSTPHLIEAKKKIVDSGMLGKIGHVEACCYFHMRANGNPSEQPVPGHLDYEMWTGPAPLRPYDGLPHKRWWRTFTEYGNGIVGDMCVHMFDTARWMLGLGWPKRIHSAGGIYVQKEGKSNISDTQVATFEYPDYNVVWQHRTWGTPPDPDYPWALFIYGEKGTLKASVHKFEFFPVERGGRVAKTPSITGTNLIELDKYPEDDAKSEQGGDKDASAAIRGQMRNWLEARANRDTPGKNRPVADVEEGYISTASCILANISMSLKGRTLEWDPKANRVVNDEQANGLLKRPYRAPWTHPADQA